MQAYSVYLHIPFCSHRCAYCDFNTYAGLESLIPEYIDALCKEIRILGYSAGSRLPVHSVFFGGGTPSLTLPALLEKVLIELNKSFDLSGEAEITIEANPGTLTQPYLQSLKWMGINRISLGMQSARVGELRMLERQHSVPDIIQAVQWARQVGFTNLNLDLIFGLPDQRLEDWQTSLEFAASLSPEHLAIYSLILEQGTPMKRWVDRGLLNQPEVDSAADMYEWAIDYLVGYDYVQYEISNWMKTTEDNQFLGCKHNMQYWRLWPYLGIGAGAHGFVNHLHTENVYSPINYIKELSEKDLRRYYDSFPRTPATTTIQPVNQRTEMGEVMLMGLRLTQVGVSNEDFKIRFGKSMWDIYGSNIEKLLNSGLLEMVNDQSDSIRLTRRGTLLGNQVFMEFV